MTDLAANPTDPEILSSEGVVTTESAAPPSRLRKILGLTGWIALGLFFMSFFTLLKLPEDRLRNYVQGTIASFLSTQNIGFAVSEGHLSILGGASYTMKDVTLSFPPPSEPVKIQEITLTPSFLPMLLGTLGGSIQLSYGTGSLKGNFAMKQNDLNLNYEAKGIDLGKLGVFSSLAGIQAGAQANGAGELHGDLNIPTTVNGQMALELSRIVIEPQTIQGFTIPRATLSEAKMDLSIDKGKATIKTFRLGKPGNQNEDLQANITGDMTLARIFGLSTLNLKATFSLSQNIMKSFVLLDALLGVAKQPDGAYAYQITGPLQSPATLPITPGTR